MCVTAVPGIPGAEHFQVLAPSSLRQTPPSKDVGDEPCPNIFGRGRSCAALIAPHTRPRTSGSKAIQYVVLTQRSGTPVVELIQLLPPFSLRNSAITV